MTKETHEPVGKFGVNETLEVISLGLLLSKGVVDSLASDNKIDMSDYINFVPALLQIPDAIADVKLIPSELKELDQSELKLIENHILEALPGIGSKWFQIAKSAFTIGSEVYVLIKVLTSKAS